MVICIIFLFVILFKITSQSPKAHNSLNQEAQDKQHPSVQQMSESGVRTVLMTQHSAQNLKEIQGNLFMPIIIIIIINIIIIIINRCRHYY